MKRKLLAIAVCAAVAAPVSAIANTELYGRINLSIDHFDGKETGVPGGIGYDEEGGTYQLNSNKSYFGVRGGADLTAGLRGFYQLEFGVFVDEGALAPGVDIFTSRNSFLGLEGGLGSVQAGRFDTPLRAMGAQVDQFRDIRYGDSANLVAGEWRPDNIIQYTSPKIADMLTIAVATVASENQADATDSGNTNNKLFDTLSVSAMLDFGDFYAGVGYDKNNFGTQNVSGLYLNDDIYSDTGVSISSLDLGLSNDIYRVVAGINMDALEIGLLLQQAEDVSDSDNKNRSYMLSAGFELTDMIKLKAQYGETDFRATDIKARQATLGADYMLGQQTKTFIYTTRQEVDGDRHFAVVGIGAEHRF
ncbi:porin [Alcanivorax sp. JB21]|uniref:porin n=1 Tax=Alcanivorax limicola TaxID=2874102 RepID=UPI001CBF1BFF|nr:porin [Alcanivorax limicola]MBZ2189850.1 porin [Alcanivorax limicola]